MSLRERLQLKHVVIGLAFLAGVVGLVLVVLPNVLEMRDLEASIAQEERMQDSLLMVIARRGDITASIEGMREETAVFERQIPRPVDLPIAIQVVRDLGDRLGVDLQRLQYIPMQQREFFHFVTLDVEANGDFISLYHFMDQLHRMFPSLDLREVLFETHGEAGVRLSLQVDLYVIPSAWDAPTPWDRPGSTELAGRAVTDRFGAPASFIRELYDNGVRIQGIVLAESGPRALVHMGGSQSWKRVGDILGNGRITGIDGQGVVVDVRGVRVRLAFEN